jgi:hypothetical protein
MCEAFEEYGAPIVSGDDNTQRFDGHRSSDQHCIVKSGVGNGHLTEGEPLETVASQLPPDKSDGHDPILKF